MAALAADRVWKEEVFVGVVVICLVISVLYLIAHIFVKNLDRKPMNKAFVRFLIKLNKFLINVYIRCRILASTSQHLS